MDPIETGQASMKIKFTKMHGTGNDFVVLDGISQSISLTQTQMCFLADRHFGVGCDQILLVETAKQNAVDFRYRIFNADGGEVEQCGNGARCFARFVRQKKLTNKSEIHVETNSGLIILHVDESDQVRVNMGAPRFIPADIPINSSEQKEKYHVILDGNKIEFGAVSMGNPHAVLQVNDVTKADVTHLGSRLETHEIFPQHANIGFMQIENKIQFKLRVYERGSAETLACGTGACAAMVIGRQWGLLDEKVTARLPGGDLCIEWAGGGDPVYLTGPASFVFEGEIEIPAELG